MTSAPEQALSVSGQTPIAAPSPTRRARRRSPSVAAGLALLVAIVLVGFVVPPLLALDPVAQDLRARTLPPLSTDQAGRFHFLGSDEFGRDVLARVAYGVRTSLAIAAVAVLIATGLGTLVGLVSGYLRGSVDNLLMLLADVQLAVPRLLLLIAVVAIFGNDVMTIAVFLGVSGWMAYARLARGIALSLGRREFVLAATALGAGTPRVLARHILPNAIAPIAVLASNEIGHVIILESTLSFLGLGVQPPTPAWGSMLADAQLHIRQAPWLMLFPGLAIFVTVLAVGLVARAWTGEGKLD